MTFESWTGGKKERGEALGWIQILYENSHFIGFINFYRLYRYQFYFALSDRAQICVYKYKSLALFSNVSP